MLVLSAGASERALAPVAMTAAGSPSIEMSADHSLMPRPDLTPAATPAESTATQGGPAARHGEQFAMHTTSDRQTTYPDLRADMMRFRMASRTTELARKAEAELDLSATDRREVQRRLQLAGFGPRGVDGIFGPGSRRAITAWQKDAGGNPTGYLTGDQLAQLNRKTDKAYHAWRVARAERNRIKLAAAPMPMPRPSNDDGCARRNSGKIAYGQSFGCDVQGLGESLGAVSDSIARLLAVSGEPTLSSRRRMPGEA